MSLVEVLKWPISRYRNKFMQVKKDANEGKYVLNYLALLSFAYTNVLSDLICYNCADLKLCDCGRSQVEHCKVDISANAYCER